MLEQFLIYLILSGSSLVSFQTTKEVMETGYKKTLCYRANMECGTMENPHNYGSLISCGICDNGRPWDLCGGMPPAANGTHQVNNQSVCGGGCTVVSSFACEQGTAVMCSLPGIPPASSCKRYGEVPEAKWCC